MLVLQRRQLGDEFASSLCFFFPVPFPMFLCLDPTFALVWIPLLLRRGWTPCSLSTALFQAEENDHTMYSSEFGRSTGRPALTIDDSKRSSREERGEMIEHSKCQYSIAMTPGPQKAQVHVMIMRVCRRMLNDYIAVSFGVLEQGLRGKRMNYESLLLFLRNSIGPAS